MGLIRTMKWKRTAQRFALFIRQFGAEPQQVEARDYRTVAIALQQQYDQLRREQPERIAEARTVTRALIREKGFIEATAGQIPIIVMARTEQQTYKKSKARLKRFYELHPNEAVPCPSCHMRCGMRKRAWLTRELAEAARQREIASKSPGRIEVYECPKHPGYWHVRHRGKQAKQASVTSKAS